MADRGKRTRNPFTLFILLTMARTVKRAGMECTGNPRERRAAAVSGPTAATRDVGESARRRLRISRAKHAAAFLLVKSIQSYLSMRSIARNPVRESLRGVTRTRISSVCDMTSNIQKLLCECLAQMRAFLPWCAHFLPHDFHVGVCSHADEATLVSVAKCISTRR